MGKAERVKRKRYPIVVGGTKTENNKIFVEQQGVRSKEELENDLRILHKAIDDRVSNEECIALMKTLVPTYKSPVEINDRGRDAPDI